MSFFDKPSSETDLIAHAVCGAYLMVAHADGKFDAAEETWLHTRLLKDGAIEGVDSAALARAAAAIGKAFGEDYAAAAEQIAEIAGYVRRNDAARAAVMHAARIAVVADQAISVQEEAAINRLSHALGLEEGAL